MDSFAAVFETPAKKIINAIQRDVGSANLSPLWGHDTGRVIFQKFEQHDLGIICRFEIETTRERIAGTGRFSFWRWLDRLTKIDATGMPTPVIDLAREREDGETIERSHRGVIRPTKNQVDLSDFGAFAVPGSNRRRVPVWRSDCVSDRPEDAGEIPDKLRREIIALADDGVQQPLIAKRLGVEGTIVVDVIRHRASC
ncbi:hypothetical protein K227x_62350 [Rubripirellula lacrimiformis]|uniref:Uncharacterized protein n=1 Tax=Rubripirellula lacrimiformis TaxID=1930273 RepID=A0A517NKY3_9BACT|nr:hypothetical protein [Rubripirellula lacrimiformis]QDT07807.1 hypothetical protein K227x_62350 [Rubripirellula lacrimiformis]